MQIRCDNCGRAVTIADTGILPESCPHCRGNPVPESLGRWNVERLIAAGGMGEVYLARHRQLGTSVAIKLLPHGPGSADANVLRERFAREAVLTASIDHPGVVRVLDFDEDAGRPYLVLELAAGRSLRSILKDGALPVDRAARIAIGVAEVLAAAHQHGVVHRDVKPENILVHDDTVRVLDFGIARALADEQPITRTGEILGTPEYMAPEQLLEGVHDVDARADVHALGLVLYEMLTGVAPFRASNLFQVLKLVESLVPPAPSAQRNALPEAFDPLLAKALSKAPEQRHADARAFLNNLRTLAPSAAAVTPRPRRPVIGIAIACLSIGAAIGWAASSDPIAPPPEPRPEPAQVIAQPDPRPSDLREVVASLGNADTADQLRLRAEAHRRLGASATALADLTRAMERDPSASRAAACAAWIEVNVLLPVAVGAPPWLQAVDTERRDRFMGAEEGAESTPFVLACRALSLGRADDAWERLPADAAPWLRLLTFRMACADPERVLEFARSSRPGSPDASWNLLAASLEGPVAIRRELRRRVDAHGAGTPDRWLFDLLLAYVEGVDEGLDPTRLRAAAELAWLNGAGEIAPLWCAGLRIDLARRSSRLRLDSDQAGRIGRLVQRFDHARHPALIEVRDVVALFEGNDPRTDLPDSVRHAAVAPIAQQPDPDLRRAIAGHQVGLVRSAGNSTAPEARLLQAITTADETERGMQWREALANNANTKLLALLPIPDGRCATPDDVAAGLLRGATLETVIPAIRASVTHGLELEPFLSLEALAEHRSQILRDVLGVETLGENR